MHLRVVLSFGLLMYVCGVSRTQNYDLSELILDYMEYKNASRLLSAFLCLRDADVISFGRKLMDALVPVVLLNPATISHKKESITKLLRYNYHKINVVVDLGCEHTKELMAEVSVNKMFNYSYAWLLITDNKSYALDLMAKLNLSVDADVVIGITSDETVLFYDTYNTGSDRNGTLNATFIGTWEMSRRLEIIKLQSFVYRRQNLTGITLKFAALTTYMDPNERDPTKYLSNIANKSYDNISKLNYALSDSPRNFFNYSVEISTWSEFGGRWNGPFFGMLGALGRKEADFTLGGTVLTLDRLEYCTPVVQNYPYWTGFLFKHPPNHSIRNVFLEPLAPSTWSAILAVSILVILMLTLAVYCNRRDGENPWSFGIHVTLATLFQQGWSGSLPGPSVYMIVFVLMLFSMLLYNFYGASVLSSLLSDPPQTIRTIADLLDFGMPAAYENVSFTAHYSLDITTVEAERNFYKKRLLDRGKPKIISRAEGIRRVRAGGFAFHTTPADAYENIAEQFTQSEICSLAEITFIRKGFLALWASRENPYREHLRIIHRRLEEVGILARERNRWFAPKPKCLGGTTTLNSIGLTNTAPAFLALFCGALAALFILGVELVYHHRVLEKKWTASCLHYRSKMFLAKRHRAGIKIVK